MLCICVLYDSCKLRPYKIHTQLIIKHISSTDSELFDTFTPNFSENEDGRG